MTHPLIRQRWSPRAFAARPVEPEQLQAVFEAARWAPSSFNEQPWRFLLATTAEPEWLAELQGYLVEGNGWARAAPVLVASAYRMHFGRTGRSNRVALRDLGAAEENMFLQAAALGLAMHQMAGFDHERLRRTLLPPGFEPGTLIAIGYLPEAEPASGDGPLLEGVGRVRLPLAEFVFGVRWGEPAPALSLPAPVWP
ncbi:MAG: nitroreductase family protein [Gemmatimonadales bacterium]